MTRLHRALFEWALERHDQATAEHKRRLLAGVRGLVLEVGSGTGANRKYLPEGARWVGLDPWLPCTIRGHGERLPIRSGAVDVVLSSFVLCSARDPDELLREAHRVLKPGGELRFIEHVGAPPGTLPRACQRWVKPVWRRVALGCEPDRDTLESIAAVFGEVQAEAFALPVPIAGPHVMGSARKPR